MDLTLNYCLREGRGGQVHAEAARQETGTEQANGTS